MVLHKHPFSELAACLSILLAVLSSTASAQAVYRCKDPSGAIKFSDQECEGGKKAYDFALPPSPAPRERAPFDGREYMPQREAYAEPYAPAPRARVSSAPDYSRQIDDAQRACSQEQRSMLRDRQGTPSCRKVKDLLALQRLQTEASVSRETGQPMPDHVEIKNYSNSPDRRRTMIEDRWTGERCWGYEGDRKC